MTLFDIPHVTFIAVPVVPFLSYSTKNIATLKSRSNWTWRSLKVIPFD